MADGKEIRETASTLNSGAIHLTRALGRLDRASGVSRARMSALSMLVFGGPRTLGELARADDVAGPTMTRIVDGLVAAGLAERRPHPRDSRAVHITATRHGVGLMRAARRRRITALARVLRDLPESDRVLLLKAAPLLDRLASGLPATSRPR